MPERDINEIIGRMVVSPTFREAMLDPNRRGKVLSRESYMTRLTPEEFTRLMEIESEVLHKFVQECVVKGLVKP